MTFGRIPASGSCDEAPAAPPIPASWTYKLSEFFDLPANDPEEQRSDAIFAYERFPKNAKKPVIWMTGTTDLTKLRGRGLSEAAIQQEIDFKREASERAAIILFLTHWHRREFEQLIRPPKPTAVLRYLISFKEAPWEEVAANGRTYIRSVCSLSAVPPTVRVCRWCSAPIPG